MNTSDMHPFIHPLSAVVDPAGVTQRLGNLQGIAKAFSQVCVVYLGKETDGGITTTAARLSGRALTAV
ncbi:hypothetical protein ACVXHB_05890 [Escherichia coli]